MNGKKKVYLRRVESDFTCKECYFHDINCDSYIDKCMVDGKDYIYKQITEAEYREAKRG